MEFTRFYLEFTSRHVILYDFDAMRGVCVCMTQVTLEFIIEFASNFLQKGVRLARVSRASSFYEENGNVEIGEIAQRDTRHELLRVPSAAVQLPNYRAVCSSSSFGRAGAVANF